MSNTDKGIARFVKRMSEIAKKKPRKLDDYSEIDNAQSIVAMVQAGDRNQVEFWARSYGYIS